MKIHVTACTSFIFHYFINCLHGMKLIADMSIVARSSDIVACEKQKRRPACNYAQADQYLYHSLSGKYNS